MPVTVSYPGVYIEELSSGVRAITGVATSVTAFVGRALRGPLDADSTSPVLLNSYSEYESIFGGLWTESAMSFAVRDFFRNGGSKALIVRLFNPTSAAEHDGFAQIALGALRLVAANPGRWGSQLRARIDHETRPRDDGSDDPDLFNLTVRDGTTGAIEVFRNVTHLPLRADSLDRVLAQQSQLVRVLDGALPPSRPPAHAAATNPWGEISAATSAGVDPGLPGHDGAELVNANFDGAGMAAGKRGLHALLKADLFNLLCIPPYLNLEDQGGGVGTSVITAAAELCEKRRAFLILDPPTSWANKAAAVSAAGNFGSSLGTSSKNAAVFFPRVRLPNPKRNDQEETFAPCGAIAGVFARTDASRGVWKAPAGLETGLAGVSQLAVTLTDPENGDLNPLAVNCLRTFPGAGHVVWGARTLRGSDRLADTDNKYLCVRRLTLFIEESLYRGTQWVVFEPNDEPLWAQIRLNVGAFMHGLFRQGAFQGQSPKEAYFVKCDKETTTQTDINLGVVNIHVGFAPLKPAEFVIIKIQQMAGQIAT